MPIILRFLAAFASSAFLVPLLKRILVALGIVAVSYGLANLSMSVILSAVQANYTSLPSDLIALMRIAKMDQALSVILSAYTAKFTMAGLTSAGVLKRVLWRPGESGSLF